MVCRGPLRAAACASRVRLGMRHCDRCYVEGGMRCATATPSSTHPGAATKECDVCTCTQTGLSNGAEQASIGCGDHGQNGDLFCYTAVRMTPVFRGALPVSTIALRAGRQQMPRCDAKRLSHRGCVPLMRPVRVHGRLAERQVEGAVQRLWESLGPRPERRPVVLRGRRNGLQGRAGRRFAAWICVEGLLRPELPVCGAHGRQHRRMERRSRD